MKFQKAELQRKARRRIFSTPLFGGRASAQTRSFTFLNCPTASPVLRSLSLADGQLQLENLAQNMSGEDVRLLDARSVSGPHFEEEVGRLGDLAASLARKGDRDRADPAGRFESKKDVPTV